MLLLISSSVAITNSSQAAQNASRNNIPSNMLPYKFDNGESNLLAFHFSSPPGNKPGESMLFHVYPVCSGAKDFDCIVSVDWIDPQGISRPGNFEDYLPVGYRGNYCQDSTRLDAKNCDTDKKTLYYPWSERILTVGDERRLIPNGSRSSIWSFPGLRHQKGNRYLVSAISHASMSNLESPLASDSIAYWNSGGSRLEIVPVGISNDTSDLIEWGWDNQKREPINFFEKYGTLWNNDKTCFLTKNKDEPICFSKANDTDFPRFKMTLRLKLTRGFLNNQHWLVSRTSDVKISTDRQSDYTTISMEGTTINLPSAVALIPRTVEGYKKTRVAINRAIADMGNQPVDINDISGFDSWSQVGSSGMSGSDPISIGFWEGIEGYAEFRADGTSKRWSFQTVNFSRSVGGWLWPCVKTPQLSGVIASNATVMRPAPPEWNAETETLEFRIASAHLDEQGKVAEGFYNLSVSREVATCLWGKDVVNARASVSVINQDGEKKIFTSSYTVNSGYLNFQISGFTYSVNTIKIRLEQAGSSSNSAQSNQDATSPAGASSTTNQSTTATKPTSSASAKKSITCVKGKTIKKVTTKTCPAGFKKR